MEMTLWKREKWLGQKCGTCWRSENCQNLSYPSSSLMIFYSLTQFSSSHPLLPFLELSEGNSFSTAWLPLFFFCFLCQTVGIASPASVSSSPASRPFAFLLHFQRCLHHHCLPISHYSSHSHPLFPFLSSLFFRLPSQSAVSGLFTLSSVKWDLNMALGAFVACLNPPPPPPSTYIKIKQSPVMIKNCDATWVHVKGKGRAERWFQEAGGDREDRKVRTEQSSKREPGRAEKSRIGHWWAMNIKRGSAREKKMWNGWKWNTDRASSGVQKTKKTRQNRERERDFHLNALTFLFAHVFAFWVETLHRESDRGNWMKKRAKLSWA